MPSLFVAGRAGVTTRHAESPGGAPYLAALRAVARSLMMRTAPTSATTSPPPTAAIRSANPSAIDPSSPKNVTRTGASFCRKKTINRTRRTRAHTTAVHTAPLRERAAASGRPVRSPAADPGVLFGPRWSVGSEVIKVPFLGLSGRGLQGSAVRPGCSLPSTRVYLSKLTIPGTTVGHAFEFCGMSSGIGVFPVLVARQDDSLASSSGTVGVSRCLFRPRRPTDEPRSFR